MSNPTTFDRVTVSMLAAVALGTLVVAGIAFDYLQEKRRLETIQQLRQTCQQCLDARTPGACSIVCGRPMACDSSTDGASDE